MNSQALKERLMKVAEIYNSPQTAAFDYAKSIAIGAAAQQAMNWATDGSDPNPLVSGVLYSPLRRMQKQHGRINELSLAREAMKAGKVDESNLKDVVFSAAKNTFQKFAQDAPIENALGWAASIGALGGAGTSIYNVVTDGQDIDNNISSAVINGLALAALAPLTYKLLRQRNQ